jgi:hypothetical protein
VRDQTSFRLRDLFRSLFLLFRSLEGRQRRQHGPLLAEESSLQVAEISRYSPDEEITSICADFLVELRGFEPMAIAGRCDLELDRR